jgi:hypothetical protein
MNQTGHRASSHVSSIDVNLRVSMLSNGAAFCELNSQHTLKLRPPIENSGQTDRARAAVIHIRTNGHLKRVSQLRVEL